MKTILAILLFFSIQSAAADCDKMMELRTQFHSTSTMLKLNNFLRDAQKMDCDKMRPYYAAAYMKKAQFAWSPIEKLLLFKKGKLLLESYIKEHPTCIEARYVRVLVQKNVPDILSYSANLTGDKNYILAHITQSNLSSAYKELIINNITS